GVRVASVTLHTGLGSFRPVEVEDLTKHRMDSEFFRVTPEAAEVVNGALRSRTNTVTVCSTTAVRAAESSLSADRALKPGSGWTDRFIFPPYSFHVTERLLTNFQLPRSTPLILVAAFGGIDLIHYAYEEAIREEYRLFAFGDAMLIIYGRGKGQEPMASSQSPVAGHVAAVVPAAGSGSRMGAGVPKQLRLLGGVPVLVRTLRAFAGHPAVDALVVAVAPFSLDVVRRLLDEHGVAATVTAGGATRQDSVR